MADGSTIDQMRQFLQSLGLDDYVSVLVNEEVDSLDTLRLVSDDDMIAMGMKIGARAKLRAALNEVCCLCACTLRILHLVSSWCGVHRAVHRDCPALCFVPELHVVRDTAESLE